MLPWKRDSAKFALGPDGGWIEKEKDIRDIHEKSSGRMRNSNVKGAGIRDQDASHPLFQALFYVGITPDETEPWIVLIEMDI